MAPGRCLHGGCPCPHWTPPQRGVTPRLADPRRDVGLLTAWAHALEVAETEANQGYELMMAAIDEWQRTVVFGLPPERAAG